MVEQIGTGVTAIEYERPKRSTASSVSAAARAKSSAWGSNSGSGSTQTELGGFLLFPFVDMTSITVDHNFNTYPLVQVIDIDNEQVIPLTIDHTTVNTVLVEFSEPTTGTIIISAGGSASPIDNTNMRQQLELVNTWRIGSGIYKEFVMTGEDVTQINYWSDATKTTKLFTKDVVYSNGNPTSITLKDEITGKTLSTTIVYNGDEIANITKTIT